MMGILGVGPRVLDAWQDNATGKYHVASEPMVATVRDLLCSNQFTVLHLSSCVQLLRNVAMADIWFNDIHADNIMFDLAGMARIIDWDIEGFETHGIDDLECRCSLCWKLTVLGCKQREAKYLNFLRRQLANGNGYRTDQYESAIAHSTALLDEYDDWRQLIRSYCETEEGLEEMEQQKRFYGAFGSLSFSRFLVRSFSRFSRSLALSRSRSLGH